MLRILFFCFSVIFSFSVFAKEDKRILHIGISFSIPPWVIQSENSGIELDILRKALDSENYRIMPHYLPFALAYKRFDAMQLDGVINAQAGVAAHGYLSDPVVTLQNVAISLAKKDYPEDLSIAQMQSRSVIAFQRASKFLGDEFAAMASENGNYQEVANQQLQLNLLFIREVDFIVMDKSIFGYFWYEALQENTQSLSTAQLERYKQPIRFHSVFPPSPYPFIFAEKKVRDDFNRGLQRLRSSGEYDQIIEKYSHLRDLYTE